MQRRRLGDRQTATPRAGLTLIEVLISVALSGILLTAIYGAVNIYFQLSHAGYKEIERSQLARVVLSRMELDLRSIVYRPDEASTSTSDPSTSTTGSTTDDTSDDTTTIEVQDPADAYGGSDSGLHGDQSSIVLHVSRPALQQDPESAALGTPTSDLKTVAYFQAGSGTGGLQAAVSSKLAAKGKSVATGLARMEGDRLTMQMAEKQGNTDALVGQSELLAEEVASVQFRYFDGLEWVTAWDSAARGALPQAVEITVELKFEDQSKGVGLNKKTVVDVSRKYRHVVALPLAASHLQATVDANSTSTTESE